MQNPGTAWFKSSYSHQNGACVEARHIPIGVAVRDSKCPDGTVLQLPRDTWATFVMNLAHPES